MSLTSITAEWGDGDHVFDLPLAQIEELEHKTGFGTLRLLRRIQTEDFKVTELREVIRLALIGGGKKELEALRLMKTHFDPAPLASMVLAHSILFKWAAAVPVSKKKPETEPSQTTTDASTSTPSTATAQQ